VNFGVDFMFVFFLNVVFTGVLMQYMLSIRWSVRLSVCHKLAYTHVDTERRTVAVR